MLKLNLNSLKDKKAWEAAGIDLPQFDVEALRRNTEEAPEWVHFGAGNIFRSFVAAAYQEVLDAGLSKTGIIAVDTFDHEFIEKIYAPYDNLSLDVSMLPSGETKFRVLACVAKSYALRPVCEERAKLAEIFKKPSLKMVSFTVTEKGYALKNAEGEYFGFVKQDMEKGPEAPIHLVSNVASLLYGRFKAGALPIAVVSMDNCSHNGEILRNATLAMVDAWVERGFVEKAFGEYMHDESRVSFPWSMIDKITPRPSDSVKQELEGLGFEDTEIVVTDKKTYIAPFVNAESTQYLFIEDNFPNGRIPLDKARGVWYTDRATVNKVETMKVTTCLNPLHTALTMFGCLFGIEMIADAVRDEALYRLIHRIGYDEGMPVVVDPKIIRPADFLAEVLERFKNRAIPDTTYRIATDTSMKLGIRYGETIKKYVASDSLSVDNLVGIPLVIAAWCRYLTGIEDSGKPFTLSADPRLAELQKLLNGVSIGSKDVDLQPILSNKEIFGCDLYEVGLGGRIEGYFAEMIAAPGAVRKTLEKYI